MTGHEQAIVATDFTRDFAGATHHRLTVDLGDLLGGTEAFAFACCQHDREDRTLPGHHGKDLPL